MEILIFLFIISLFVSLHIPSTTTTHISLHLPTLLRSHDRLLSLLSFLISPLPSAYIFLTLLEVSNKEYEMVCGGFKQRIRVSNKEYGQDTENSLSLRSCLCLTSTALFFSETLSSVVMFHRWLTAKFLLKTFNKKKGVEGVEAGIVVPGISVEALKAGRFMVLQDKHLEEGHGILFVNEKDAEKIQKAIEEVRTTTGKNIVIEKISEAVVVFTGGELLIKGGTAAYQVAKEGPKAAIHSYLDGLTGKTDKDLATKSGEILMEVRAMRRSLEETRNLVLENLEKGKQVLVKKGKNGENDEVDKEEDKEDLVANEDKSGFVNEDGEIEDGGSFWQKLIQYVFGD